MFGAVTNRTTSKNRFPVMTSNPNFEDYVERVQENLAVLSLSSDQAKKYLMESKPLATYNPRFIAFEILFNDRPNDVKYTIQRKFDPHVSDKLIDQASLKSCLKDIRRLFKNAEYLNLDLSTVDWSIPNHIKGGLSKTTKEKLEELSSKDQRIVKDLTRLHKELSSVEETDLDKPGIAPQIEQRLKDVRALLKYLLQRYEVQYIPTNVGSTALVYEAWKQGKLIPLGNPEKDKKKFDRLLSAFFLRADEKLRDNQTGYEELLKEMAECLNLDNPTICHINKDELSNERTWVGTPEGWTWFTCIESSLIHKLDLTKQPIGYRYLIYYPLLIDDYWFAGVALIYSDLNVDPSKGDIPEVFDRRKYAKIYNTIKSVSDTLKISLRQDAFEKAEKQLREANIKDDENLENSIIDIFLDVIKDYFVCFNARKVGDDNESHLLDSRIIYEGHGIQLYGPGWLIDKTPKRLELIEREIDGYDSGVRYVSGLFKSVVELAKDIAQEREEKVKQGVELQSQKFSHQAAGLMKTVMRDSSLKRLGLRSRANLWHLNTLIQVWGTNDLYPNEPIVKVDSVQGDFPDWSHKSVAEIMRNLEDFALDHALSRATERRPSPIFSSHVNNNPEIGFPLVDDTVRQEAFEILVKDNPTDELRNCLGFTSPNQEWPEWSVKRGFVLCFHHAFWQAAYHAFRALHGGANPLRKTQNIYLQVSIGIDSVRILNSSILSSSGNQDSSRDADFFKDLNQRLGDYFYIKTPVGYGEYWLTEIKVQSLNSEKS